MLTETWLGGVAWNAPLSLFVSCLDLPPVVYIPCKHEKSAHVDWSFHAKDKSEALFHPTSE